MTDPTAATDPAGPATPAPALAELTTLKVGGPAERFVRGTETVAIVAELQALWRRGEDWLVLGGGSNLLVGDEEVPGTVLQLATKGIRAEPEADGSRGPRTVHLHVAAGEDWDGLVAHSVEQGWSGIEALSGIPGRAGAAPVQNIGAYGQELADSLVSVVFLDYLGDAPVVVSAEELALGYRTSSLKEGRTGVVLGLTLALRAGDGLSEPIAYPQLAGALGVAVGERAPLGEVRAAVLALRASKGMVLDADDPDSVSAGSFFTNPIVSEAFARQLPEDAPRWSLTPEPADRVIPLDAPEPGTFTSPIPTIGALSTPQPGERLVKLSAAWLIEHSGITRGFALPGSRVGVSSKHTLALVNRGGGTAEQVAELARYIQSRVTAEFGVLLQPEPVRVGVEL